MVGIWQYIRLILENLPKFTHEQKANTISARPLDQELNELESRDLLSENEKWKTK